MTLKQGLNQVGENPFLSEFIETPQLQSLCEALVVRMTLPLAPPENDGLIVQKFREKVESLSLKLSLFIPLSFLLFSFLPSYCLVQDGPRACPLTCHMSNFHWLLRFPLILSSIYHGFPSNGIMSHVTYSPNLSSLFDLLTA